MLSARAEKAALRSVVHAPCLIAWYSYSDLDVAWRRSTFLPPLNDADYNRARRTVTDCMQG